MMKKNIKSILFLLIAIYVNNVSHAYESAHDVEILYWYEQKGDKHYYYYNVINNSSTVEIVNIRVGYKYDYDTGEPQLFAPRADTTHIPLEFISPNGWNGSVAYLEESLNYSLMWETTDETYDIKEEDSSYQFGVVLSNQRNDHINSFFTIIFGDSTKATEEMVASSEPPRNIILAPIYDLLLSKGITPNVVRINKSS